MIYKIISWGMTLDSSEEHFCLKFDLIQVSERCENRKSGIFEYLLKRLTYSANDSRSSNRLHCFQTVC